MIVFIDRQHAGKPSKINDRGASRDINGDGEITAEELEAIWTARIAINLEIRLLDMGISVMPISDGTYSKRHERVNQYADMHPGPWVYLAMHLNSGGGNYGSYFYDYRSTKGQQLATIMANKLNEDVENDINSILFDNKLNDSEILLKLEEAKHITKENTSSNFSDYNSLNTMGILKSNNNKNLDNVVNLIKNSYIYDKLLLNKN